MTQATSPITKIANQDSASQEQFDYAAVSAEMELMWPQLFGPELHIPLKIGITEDLHAEAIANGSRLSKRKIRLFLGRYCTHPEYLKQIADGQPRHDANGIAIDEEISARHINNASGRLLRGRGKAEEVVGPEVS